MVWAATRAVPFQCNTTIPTTPEENDVTNTTAPKFETDIKRLFRERDRGAMLQAFDLWSYEDVKTNADRILAAVSSGSMPCDGRWPEEQVNLLRRWVDGDKLE
jgi:hypothetical protein